MMRRPELGRHWRIVIGIGDVAIIAIFFVVWLASIVLFPENNAIFDAQVQSMEASARSAAAVAGDASDALSQKLGEIDGDSGMRIVVVSTAGDAVADSNGSVSDPSSYALQRAALEALDGGEGAVVIPASGGASSQEVVVKPFSADRGSGFAVVSKSVEAMDKAIVPAQIMHLGMLLACLLAASLVAYWFFGFAVSSIERIERDRAEFMANASHELKTPVAGMRLLAETLLIAVRRKDEAAIKDFAERIDGESARMSRLVSDLVESSRYGSSVVRRARERRGCAPLDFRDAVARAFESRWVLADSKDLEYRLLDEISPYERCTVLIDEADAGVIIDNLIDNAIEYTDSGSVTARLRISDEAAVFSVSDTGVGISRYDCERIFERFYRVEDSKAKNGRGSGLGLSLAANAAALAGGRIEVESVVGRGSTFTAVLPLAESSQPPFPGVL